MAMLTVDIARDRERHSGPIAPDVFVARAHTTVLYTHVSPLIGGGNKVMLSLFGALDRSRYRPHSLIPGPGPIEQHLRNVDVPFTAIDLRPSASSRIGMVTKAARVAAVARRLGARIVHASEPSTYRLLSIGGLLSGMKRVCHIQHPLADPNELSWSFRVPPAIVITGSHYVAELVRGLLVGGVRPPVVPVWNPIDTDWFSPVGDVAGLRQELGLSPRKRHISIVGALARHKGHECFLRMAQLLHQRLGNCEFHIIGSAKTGSADHAQRLQQLTDDLGLRRVVRFWGYVDDGQARSLIQASDLFVLPTEEEGFCLVAVEAQACGVPVLTSAIRPLDEVVENGTGGFRLPTADYGAFASRAAELLQHEDHRRDLAQRGRAWVCERFALRPFASRIAAIYDDLLRVPSRP